MLVTCAAQQRHLAIARDTEANKAGSNMRASVSMRAFMSGRRQANALKLINTRQSDGKQADKDILVHLTAP